VTGLNVIDMCTIIALLSIRVRYDTNTIEGVDWKTDGVSAKSSINEKQKYEKETKTLITLHNVSFIGTDKRNHMTNIITLTKNIHLLFMIFIQFVITPRKIIVEF